MKFLVDEEIGDEVRVISSVMASSFYHIVLATLFFWGVENDSRAAA